MYSSTTRTVMWLMACCHWWNGCSLVSCLITDKQLLPWYHMQVCHCSRQWDCVGNWRSTGKVIQSNWVPTKEEHQSDIPTDIGENVLCLPSFLKNCKKVISWCSSTQTVRMLQELKQTHNFCSFVSSAFQVGRQWTIIRPRSSYWYSVTFITST